MSKKTRLVRLFPLLGLLVIASVAGGVVFMIKEHFLADAAAPKKFVHQITLIQPPPPPPPPPPEVKPPEPEIQEEVEVEEPEDAPEEMPESVDNAPIGDDLGLDAEGVAGADGFGLIGRKGGRGLLDGGPFAWYAGMIQQDIEDLLADKDTIRVKSYTVLVELWIEKDGRVRQAELIDTTGNKEVDDSLQLALTEIRQLRERPPEDLPQPVKVRITSRI